MIAKLPTTVRLVVAGVLLCIPAGGARADPAPVVRAGEWEMRQGGDGGTSGTRPPRRVCLRADRAFDQATLDRLMAISKAKCAASGLRVVGSVIEYATTCEIGGGHMTMNSTITFNGADEFTAATRSHLEGGTIKLPDMNVTSISRRLGACQPGDAESPF